MSKKSYTLKDPDSIKRHKFLRGLRRYVSSLSALYATRPVVFTTQRASRIVDNLSLSERNVALLSFHKSMHSSVIIMNTCNTYSYLSVFEDSACFLNCVSKKHVVEEIADDERFLRAELSGQDAVYISGLNTLKMMRYVCEGKLDNYFDSFSNNCSRIAADFLLAGCDIKPTRFEHNRPKWQMPANTKELAKEIDMFLRSRTRR